MQASRKTPPKAVARRRLDVGREVERHLPLVGEPRTERASGDWGPKNPDPGRVGEVGPVGGAVARAADRRRRPDVGRDVDRDAMVDEAVE